MISIYLAPRTTNPAKKCNSHTTKPNCLVCFSFKLSDTRRSLARPIRRIRRRFVRSSPSRSSWRAPRRVWAYFAKRAGEPELSRSYYFQIYILRDLLPRTQRSRPAPSAKKDPNSHAQYYGRGGSSGGSRRGESQRPWLT